MYMNAKYFINTDTVEHCDKACCISQGDLKSNCI